MLLTLLCWFAIIFFFAATVRKFMDYAKKPMHGRQDLYPIPGEPEEKAEHGDLILKTKNGGNSHAKRTMLAKSWIC